MIQPIAFSIFLALVSGTVFCMTPDQELAKEFETLSEIISRDARPKKMGIGLPSETLSQTINLTFPDQLKEQMNKRMLEHLSKQKVEQLEKEKAELEKQKYDQFIACALARIKTLLASPDPLDHIIAWQESHALRMGFLTKFQSMQADQATPHK